MNKILIFSFFIFFISCKKKERLSENSVTKENLEIFYEIKWLENQLNSESKELVQLYVSNKKDTLYNQRKIFKNGILDTLQSSFYHLDFKRSNSRSQGNLYVKSSLNSKIKNPINEKGLWLYLIQFEKNKMDVVEFHSINSNNIEFDYRSEKDVIMGVVKEQIEVDTIVNGEKMIRLLETTFIIDLQEKTTNPLIQAFKDGE